MGHIEHENIINHSNRSFEFRGDRIFYADEIGYHVHPEMELMAITCGGGKCIINEHIDDFEDFDVVFVPGGIPHCWILDPLQCDEDGIINDYCCQFANSFLLNIGNIFPELKAMTEYYSGLRQAIRIEGASAQNVINTYRNFNNLTDGKQTIALLELLNIIYESGEYRLIGLPSPKDIHITKPRIRFQNINKLIMENYGRSITLSEAAESVEMNPTAFCNAFKATTGKTFNTYLTTYRLQVAARLLSTTMMSISEIAYKVGFNDLPHFTRTFKKHYNISPSEYRKMRTVE